MGFFGVAPFPQHLARGLAHGDEKLVICEGLNDTGEQHEVSVWNDIEAQKIILGEHVCSRLATSIVEGLLPDAELGRRGVALGGRRGGHCESSDDATRGIELS